MKLHEEVFVALADEPMEPTAIMHVMIKAIQSGQWVHLRFKDKREERVFVHRELSVRSWFVMKRAIGSPIMAVTCADIHHARVVPVREMILWSSSHHV